MEFENSMGRKEMLSCLLCKDAPCTDACGKLDCGKLLQSVWFANADSAAVRLPDNNPCINCDAQCEKACISRGTVNIRSIVSRLYEQKKSTQDIDLPSYGLLRTDICGVEFENPFILSSSVVASNYDMCARAFEAGWAGVSYKTICSMDIHEASPRFSAIYGSDGAIVGFKNIEQLSIHSVADDMEIFRRLKANYPNKRIIASIMGKDEAEWGVLAARCEESGADLIELNFSCPNMMEEGFGSDIGQCPELVERYTRSAKSACTLPVLAKLTPNTANMKEAAEAAKRGGADGFAAINTIKSIIGVNPHTYISSPAVHGRSAVGGYSGQAVKPIALRFVAELAQNKELSGMPVSGMGGIETWEDALEFIMLGCSTVQMTTSVMQYGYRIIDDLKEGLALYLARKGVKSVKEAVGIALENVDPNTDELERDSIIYPKFLRTRCVGCGRCAISCADGGHQAIRFGADRKPILEPKKCVGCHLCVLVCPEKAIVPGRKRITPKK